MKKLLIVVCLCIQNLSFMPVGCSVQTASLQGGSNTIVANKNIVSLNLTFKGGYSYINKDTFKECKDTLKEININVQGGYLYIAQDSFDTLQASRKINFMTCGGIINNKVYGLGQCPSIKGVNCIRPVSSGSLVDRCSSQKPGRANKGYGAKNL